MIKLLAGIFLLAALCIAALLPHKQTFSGAKRTLDDKNPQLQAFYNKLNPAAVLSFNTSGWAQRDINLMQAAVSYLVAQQGITHDGIKCVNQTCVVLNPSADPAITESDVRDFLAQQAAAEEADRLAHPEDYL